MHRCVMLTVLATSTAVGAGSGLLHPQESESREIKDLTGLWRFRADKESAGFREQWPSEGLPPPTIAMAVPSSYNDLTTDSSLRDHVGLVWYEREVFVPLHWMTRRVVLFVGSANHHAVAFLNGHMLGQHEGGHLPFHLPLNAMAINFGKSNRLVVAVNNTLSTTTIPPGFVQVNAAGRRIQRLQMDFFNYAGIHRQVLLYATPTLYLDDILISCRLDGTIAHLNVFVAALVFDAQSAATSPAAAAASVLITLKDAADRVVARGRMPSDPRRGGRLQVHDAQLWWPRDMSTVAGYMYTIVVEVLSADGNVSDVYRLKYGLRTVEVSQERGFLINGRPFYFHGFGKHEDSDIRGRALDLPQLVKDMSLMNWIGGNSVRTTHYPYSEEFLQMCDEIGIVVISEAPAVGLQAVNMVRETLRTHLETVSELVTRDKNHPSVVMWSVANEPDSEAAGASTYFKHLVAHTRSLDPSRPVTFASFKAAEKDVAVQYVDVLLLNRYVAWYTDTGQLDVVQPKLRQDLIRWRRKFAKPILLSEYGADTVAGLHATPAYAFTEEFQSEYLSAHFDVFDELRAAGFFIGEHVWSFADFMTTQGVTRVVGNRKGVFTRQRQPKYAAHVLRRRYTAMANASVRWPLSLAQLNALDTRQTIESRGGGVADSLDARLGARAGEQADQAWSETRQPLPEERAKEIDEATDVAQVALAKADGTAEDELAAAEAAMAVGAAQLMQEDSELNAARGGGMGATHVWAE